jgi:potassium uptake Trk family protein
MGLAIFGSICLYPRGGGLAYIDALFLSSGAATQSGLNTVNINDINTWQQVALHCIAMCGNPITINTFVVFLRLYWFEKRFQHIAMEAKKNRRSTSKSFSKSKTAERDIGREERGVQGRDIVVMHESARGMKNEGAAPEDLERYLKEAVNQEERPRSSNETGEGSGQSSDSADERKESAAQQHQTQIRFADQVKRSDNLSDQPLQVPAPRKTEEHIAFLERQRNPDDDTVLRIPGPRDADAGVDPQMVDQSESTQQLSRRRSTFDSSRESDDQGHFSPLNGADTTTNEPRRRNITITEPTRRETPKEHIEEDAIAAKHVFGALRFRKPRILHGEKLHNDADTPHPSRSRRSSTFQSFKQALSQDKDGGIPYLSWEPTVGRNSAFVDLTESQREELGGIEYRSLKSLALILTLYFWGFSLFGVVCLLPWILNSQTYGSIVEQDGQGRVWWGIFTANSAFTDLGYTLTPDSMISFNTAIWPLLLMSFLIIIGNTGFPIMLRIIIWITSLYVPKNSGIFEELKFLLDHPRRCFTLLFPSKATWWLFWILVVLNGLDLIFFIVLDVHPLSSYSLFKLTIKARKYNRHPTPRQYPSPRRLVPSRLD